jgi:hypothetical protein
VDSRGVAQAQAWDAPENGTGLGTPPGALAPAGSVTGQRWSRHKQLCALWKTKRVAMVHRPFNYGNLPTASRAREGEGEGALAYPQVVAFGARFERREPCSRTCLEPGSK